MSFLIAYSSFSRIIYLSSSTSPASNCTGSKLQKAPATSTSPSSLSSSASPPSPSSTNAKKPQPKTKLRGKALRRAVCSGTAHRVLMVPSMADLVTKHTIREHMVSKKSTRTDATITTTEVVAAAAEDAVKAKEGLANSSSSSISSGSQVRVPFTPGTTTSKPAPTASGLKKMKRWGVMQSGSARHAQQFQLSDTQMEKVKREAEALRFSGMRRVWAEAEGLDSVGQRQ